MSLQRRLMTLPNWDPGTSELKHQNKRCGLAKVVVAQALVASEAVPPYDAIEHLVYVISPGSESDHIAYPHLIPMHAPGPTSTTPVPADTVVEVTELTDSVDFLTHVKTRLEGCRVGYVVARRDYYVGLPRIPAAETGPTVIHADLIQEVRAPLIDGRACAEAEGDGGYFVHQVAPFRMHLDRVPAKQKPGALPASRLLKDVFSAVATQDQVWLYSRAYARFVGEFEVAKLGLECAPLLPEGRTLATDHIRGVIGIEPPLLP